jgi:hypothetical protein
LDTYIFNSHRQTTRETTLELIFDPECGEEVKGIEHVVTPCNVIQTRLKAGIQSVQEYSIHKSSNTDKRINCNSSGRVKQMAVLIN